MGRFQSLGDVFLPTYLSYLHAKLAITSYLPVVLISIHISLSFHLAVIV